MTFKLLEFKNQIVGLYKFGFSPAEISRLYGCYLQPVTNLLKQELSVDSFSPCKGDVHYFSKIDTLAKAYIIGFIAADGALVPSSNTGGSSSPTLSITLNHLDRDVLEFIKSQIGNCHELQTIKRNCSFNPETKIHHVRYTLTNKQIASDLQQLGITFNKSLIMGDVIKNIPNHLRKAFVIGYFDGDGSVTLPLPRKKYVKKLKTFIEYPSYRLAVDIRGTKKLLLGLAEEIGLINPQIKQYDSIPRLQITNKVDIVKFFKCYDDLPFFFKRKHDKFLKRIHHPSYKLL